MLSFEYLKSLNIEDNDLKIRIVTQILVEGQTILKEANDYFMDKDYLQSAKKIHKLKGSLFLILDNKYKLEFNKFETEYKKNQNEKMKEYNFKKISAICEEVFFELRKKDLNLISF